MLTDDEIEAGKRQTANKGAPRHDHPDCIRLAYEWLDAQTKLNGTPQTWRPIKELIARWAGRHVDQANVEVAATLHPDVRGTYPNYGISMRLVRPKDRRLDGISEALAQDSRREGYWSDRYAKDEA